MTDEHPDALLAAYTVDGLSDAERIAVERHLAGCARCQARVQSLETTARLLRALPAPPLPRSFLLPPTTAPRRPAPRPLFSLSFLSAAAVLFLAFGLSVASSRSGAVVAQSGSSAAQAPALVRAATPVRSFGAATTAAATSAAASSRAAITVAAARAAATTQSAAAASTAASGAASRPAAAAAALVPRLTPPSTAAPSAGPAAPGAEGSASRAVPPVAAPQRASPTVRPYQVLLAVGGIICLAVALTSAVRNRRFAMRQ